MQRLAISGFFAIALLSGCTGGGGGSGVGVRGEPQPNDITLPCPGKDVKTGDWPVERVKQTLSFHTDGRCKFKDLQFGTPYNQPPYNGLPPGFSNRVDDSGGKTISYTYDGRPIPDAGYPYSYTNNYPEDGNGSGVIK
jgi:hypothetical protein